MNKFTLKIVGILVVAGIGGWMFWNNAIIKGPREISSLGTSEHIQGSIYIWPKVLSKNGYTINLDAAGDLSIKNGVTEIFHTQ